MLDVVQDRVTSPITREIWVRLPSGPLQGASSLIGRAPNVPGRWFPSSNFFGRYNYESLLRCSSSFRDTKLSGKGGVAEMTKLNVWKRMFPARTHEGAVAQNTDAKRELRRSVL